MASLKGSKTEKNLMASFAGESQARNRYSYFSSQARKDGFEQIAALFQETADNEKEHAKLFFKFLEGGVVKIEASYPAGVIGETKANLKAAADGELEEHTQLYPEAAKIAAEEGFNEVAATFRAIAGVEKWHERRYRQILKNLEEGNTFKRADKVFWKCRECGHVHEGASAPKLCPVCKHAQAYFEQFVENY